MFNSSRRVEHRKLIFFGREFSGHSYQYTSRFFRLDFSIKLIYLGFGSGSKFKNFTFLILHIIQ